MSIIKICIEFSPWTTFTAITIILLLSPWLYPTSGGFSLFFLWCTIFLVVVKTSGSLSSESQQKTHKTCLGILHSVNSEKVEDFPGNPLCRFAIEFFLWKAGENKSYLVNQALQTREFDACVHIFTRENT